MTVVSVSTQKDQRRWEYVRPLWGMLGEIEERLVDLGDPQRDEELSEVFYLEYQAAILRRILAASFGKSPVEFKTLRKYLEALAEDRSDLAEQSA